MLLAQTVHHALGFGEALGGAAGIRLRSALIAVLRTLLSAFLSRAHVIHGLIQAVQRLLQLLLIGSLLLPAVLLLLALLPIAGKL